MMNQHPSPEYRQHRTISVGQFAPGAAIARNGSIYCIIPIASAGRFRFRFKASVGGSLTASLMAPGIIDGEYSSFTELLDGTDVVSTMGNPDAVVIVADTENVIEITDLCGEAFVLVKFTEADVAAGTVTFANYCQL